MSTTPPHNDASLSRLLARIIVDGSIRGTTVWIRAFNGDLPLACVWLALDLANIEPIISTPDGLRRYLSGDFNDDDRRPISIRALGGSLGFDVETTRRYVHKLADAGYCSHRPDGVVLNSSCYDKPEIKQASANILTVLASTLAQLERWGALPPDPARSAAITATSDPVNMLDKHIRTIYRVLFSEYIFKFSIESAPMFQPYSMLRMNILMNILNENNTPLLEDDDLALQYSRIDTPVPDTLRLPTTVRALARTSGFAPETVRRHVKGLIDMRLVEARPAGLVVPTEVTARPEFIKAIQDMTVWATAAIRKIDRLSAHRQALEEQR